MHEPGTRCFLRSVDLIACRNVVPTLVVTQEKEKNILKFVKKNNLCLDTIFLSQSFLNFAAKIG